MPGGGTPGSTVVVAEAQLGGIPARSGVRPGQGNAKVLILDGDDLFLSSEIRVLNPSLKIAGAMGDRLIWLSDSSNGALVLGWDDPNTNQFPGFQILQPQSE